MAVENIRLNHRNIQLLLKNPRIRARLELMALLIAEKCGEGYLALPSTRYHKIARAAVVTVSDEARADNAKNNTILRNMDAAR